MYEMKNKKQFENDYIFDIPDIYTVYFKKIGRSLL